MLHIQPSLCFPIPVINSTMPSKISADSITLQRCAYIHKLASTYLTLLQCKSQMQQLSRFLSKSSFAAAHLKSARQQMGITQGIEKPGKTRFGGWYYAATSIRRCLPAIERIVHDGVIEVKQVSVNNFSDIIILTIFPNRTTSFLSSKISLLTASSRLSFTSSRRPLSHLHEQSNVLNLATPTPAMSLFSVLVSCPFFGNYLTTMRGSFHCQRM